MGFIGPIRLIRLIIRHYESDEEWGLALMAAGMLLAGCRREKTAQAEGAPAENSRMAAVDSTKKGIELIRRDGRGMELDR